MRSILTAGLKYFLWFLLLYGALTAVSLIPQVGAACNALYRQPTEWLLKGLFPKAYLNLKARPGDADVIIIEYASKEKIAQAQMEARTKGGQVQIPGKVTDMKFYNMFLSFHLFFVALMLLSPITWKEKLAGIVIGSILFYLFTVFRISLSLTVLFNQPDVAIYQTGAFWLNTSKSILYFLTLGVKVLVVLLLWVLLAFRKQNWKELLQVKDKG
ncbi:MAG TPA: hypothetical protein PKE06_21790 [Flavilitoribacter sp.]|nr:hypothetical protein [Flavilitoribacter sp.]HMQ86643.1 hypothetical protein [Flavilitoribacter sp.]